MIIYIISILERMVTMKKTISFLISAAIFTMSIFAQNTPSPDQIRRYANELGVPYEILQQLVDSYTSKDVLPEITGTIVPGSSLTEKLAWLQRSADSHNTYILEVNANENIDPHTFYYEGAINITVVLRGDNINRTIRLKSHSWMFKIRSNVTFILDNNITLHGHPGNTSPLVWPDSGGTFIMRPGSTITGNINTSRNLNGGAVGINGTFEMIGGTISGNTSPIGGGVTNFGKFIMRGGIISGNTASEGGGVYTSGTFTMNDGIITGNTAGGNGGGVHFSGGTFNKSGGTITGYSSDSINGNVVKDDAGNVLARRGYAVFVNSGRRKETTAGPEVSLNNNTAEGWDN
jgi:hypothetical protein